MFFRFLSVAGLLCLSSAAAVTRPQSNDISNPEGSGPHQVHLLYSNCSRHSDSKSYLTVDFSVENGSVLANRDQIFPPTTSMQLHAARNWGSDEKDDENVSLTYELDVKPLPPSQIDVPQGDVKVDADVDVDILLLQIRLLDQSGRPATPDMVAIRLARNPEGELLISKIWIDSSPDYRHGRWEWKHWRAQVNACLIAMKNVAEGKGYPWSSQSGDHKSHGSHEDPFIALLNDHTRHSQGRRPSGHTHNADTEDEYPFRTLTNYPMVTYRPSRHGHDRAYLRLMRPVVLPALLGIVAGVIACAFGFVMGKAFLSLLVFMQKRKRTGSVGSEEAGTDSEKDGLMGRARTEELR